MLAPRELFRFPNTKAQWRGALNTVYGRVGCQQQLIGSRLLVGDLQVC